MSRAIVPPLVALLALAGCAANPQGKGLATLRPVDPPATMQYLYGSGEAAALSLQAFRAMTGYVATRIKARPADSVVLTEGATLDQPAFRPCGSKPYAAVFDVDETLVLNLGFEYHDARSAAPYSDALWDAWERTGAGQVSAVPGAVDAVGNLRAAGITVIFNSNRAAANAAATAAAIRNAGLGEAVHGDTLYLKGDDASGSKKDDRRAAIAARYCVIAMGGDQLGDFSDLFNAALDTPSRRAAAMGGKIAQMWSNGWFVLPNPVYGSGLKGGFDDVFPLDKRWDAPAEKESN